MKGSAIEHRASAPDSVNVLLARANQLVGRSLADVAQSIGADVPTNLVRAKGWAGELIEAILGGAGGSVAGPDFPHLGIELKTLPILANGRARESTHVCVMPLDDQTGLTWERSLVRQKLAHVLWVPLLSPRGEALAERRICTPLLWRPTQEQEAQLRADWEELMEFATLGRIHELTAHHGRWLQVRPKAANAKSVTWTRDHAGRRIPTNPRGFYLRPSFTNLLLAQNFILPNSP